jgi:hypothetical protein
MLSKIKSRTRRRRAGEARRRNRGRRRRELNSGATTVPWAASATARQGTARSSPGTAAHEDHEEGGAGKRGQGEGGALKAVSEGTAGDVTTDYFGNEVQAWNRWRSRQQQGR